MGTITMTKGQNLALPADAGSVQLCLRWAKAGTADLDLVALVVGSDRRVRSDNDMVFYNQHATADGSVAHAAKTAEGDSGSDTMVIDLEALPESAECVVVAACIDNAIFSEVEILELVVQDPSGAALLQYPIDGLSTETAVVLAEVYRRNGSWRVRAVGQGWESGLAGLVSDFGVNVEADPDPGPDHGEIADAVGDTPGQPDKDVFGGHEPPADLQDQPPTRHADPAAPPPAKRVRVRDSAAKRMLPPVPSFALDQSWQASRLFSVAGIGGADEQEQRATSALMWTMAAVRPLARALTARASAPAGAVETFLEVHFPFGDRAIVPDAVIRIVRGSRSWTALVEVKTGDGALRREQVESYLALAKKRSFDAVLTISNDLSSDPDTLPVELSSRLTNAVPVVHISWSEVMHEVRMLLAHHIFTDQMSVWILSELLRYLEHPRSGAISFHDMGPAWVPVRESVVARTLRPGDKKLSPVVGSWFKLCRQVALSLTARLGVPVRQTFARKLVGDPIGREADAANRLSTEGVLRAAFRIPDAAGQMSVVADLRAGTVLVSMDVDAPKEGTAAKRISWLTRQCRDAPDKTLLEVRFEGTLDTTCEMLADVRDTPSTLIPGRDYVPSSFTLTTTSPLGSKRSGPKGSFVSSINAAIDTFYVSVLERIRPWTPPAPQLQDVAVPSGDPAEALV